MAKFDRIDIVEAHYLYYLEYYDGMVDWRYERLCKILEYFKPSPYGSLSKNGEEIYNDLVQLYEGGEIRRGGKS